jgi:hypothetical protein
MTMSRAVITIHPKTNPSTASPGAIANAVPMPTDAPTATRNTPNIAIPINRVRQNGRVAHR